MMFKTALFAGLALAASAFPVNDHRLSFDVVEAFESNERVDVLVYMNDRVDIFREVARNRFGSRGERAQFVHDKLTAFAQQQQKDVMSLLDANNNEHGTVRSLWATNMIVVRDATPQMASLLSNHPDVDEVTTDLAMHLHEPVERVENVEKRSGNEWGVDLIDADAVWAAGNTGEGIIVANIDTGARWTHEALIGSYAGGAGDHDYHWFDPYLRTAEPNDGNGHGTHTIGTVAGTHGIGVAPGAKWISAKGCRSSSCYTSDLIESFEFMICPTRTDGSDPDCSKVPHVVNNSWGGGQGTDTYHYLNDALIAAGVVPVFSQGNSGSRCGTANSPGDNNNVIGVGSTDSSDALSYFSSRGPAVKSEFTGLQKPEVSAPGSAVTSAYHTSDTAYASLSGTSMAAPHVTGAVALVQNFNENLSFQEILDIMQFSCDTENLRADNQDCGGVDDDTYPNYSFGYGRINACSAVRMAGGDC